MAEHPSYVDHPEVEKEETPQEKDQESGQEEQDKESKSSRAAPEGPPLIVGLCICCYL